MILCTTDAVRIELEHRELKDCKLLGHVEDQTQGDTVPVPLLAKEIASWRLTLRKFPGETGFDELSCTDLAAAMRVRGPSIRH